MVPYVRAVQAPAIIIEYWSKITAGVATSIANQARKTPGAAIDNATSAYATADQVVSGISGSGGTQALLQAYIDSPSTSRQTAATSALNTTVNQLNTLLSSTGTLDAVLDSGSAQAFPTIWYGSACAFLQPASGSTSWWTANNWANTTFYQISDRVRQAAGKLTVNGNGTYRVVVLSAGRALGTQNRGTRTTFNFFECIDPPINSQCNHNALRDNDATSPVTKFWNATVSDTFNDRLAY